jgi:hypothetical protein
METRNQAGRSSVASLTPCRALTLTLTLTLTSVVSAGAVRTREAPLHNAARGGLDRVASNLGLMLLR